MQDLYFQQLKNRDVGPLSANQVRQMIRSGQIQSSDKLRVDGEALAYPAKEFLAFRDEIERTTAQETNGRRWVCMRVRDMRQGSTAAMCGPYTRKEIVSLILNNQLSPSDYVWREGFTTWKTLDSVTQLQLPIPSFPRATIAWKNQALDWTPSPAPQAPRNKTVDRALDAAIVLVCGLLAWIVWQLAFPQHVKRANPHAPRAAASAKPAPEPKIKYYKAPAKRAPAKSAPGIKASSKSTL